MRINNIKEFDYLVFKYFKYTPKTFGFNFDSFGDLYLNEDSSLNDSFYYFNKHQDFLKFTLYIKEKNRSYYKFKIVIDNKSLYLHYINNNCLHRFDNWAFKKIVLLNKNYKKYSCVIDCEQYRLFGTLHNLKGPAYTCYDYSYNKYNYMYYIYGKEYHLNDYCKIISKKMDLLND